MNNLEQPSTIQRLLEWTQREEAKPVPSVVLLAVLRLLIHKEIKRLQGEPGFDLDLPIETK